MLLKDQGSSENVSFADFVMLLRGCHEQNNPRLNQARENAVGRRSVHQAAAGLTRLAVVQQTLSL